ncbi:gluconate 2-dehydrogenase subunit 3 family protein, partial [Acinetobacter baumannii]
KDPALVGLYTDGVKALDQAATQRYGKPYAALTDEDQRVRVLSALEDSAFFRKVRADMITALYTQPEVWARLGYEGPSAEFGGYLH